MSQFNDGQDQFFEKALHTLYNALFKGLPRLTIETCVYHRNFWPKLKIFFNLNTVKLCVKIFRVTRALEGFILISDKKKHFSFLYSCTAFTMSGSNCQLYVIGPFEYQIVPSHPNSTQKSLIRKQLFTNN